MKVVGIIENNGITGVKYGVIEVPDIITPDATPDVAKSNKVAAALRANEAAKKSRIQKIVTQRTRNK